MSSVLEPGGGLSRSLRDYEDRPQQRRMAEAVTHALEGAGVALIEAGTGTGKSFAYLVPAVLFAAGGRDGEPRRVVISTGTRALQDQLAERDVPTVLEMLQGATELPVEATVLKGTSNYLCRRKHEQLRKKATTASLFGGGPEWGDLSEERTAHELVDDWLRHTTTGDRAELGELATDDPIWAQLTTSSDARLGSRCPHFERCFVTRARRRAERAQLIIVNHHLYAADLALRAATGDTGILPAHDAVIFDEAHLLESALVEHFSARIGTAGITRLASELRDLGERRSALGMPVELEGRTLASWSSDLEQRFIALAAAITAELGDELATASSRPCALPAGLFSREDVESRWFAVDDALAAIAAALHEDADGSGDTELGIGREAEVMARRLAGQRDALAAVADRRADAVRTAARSRSGLTLAAAPVEVASIFRDRVAEAGPAVILTSATLSCAGDFSLTRHRLGLDDGRADELCIESPFRHERQALLYVASDLPDPRHDDFVHAAVARIAELVDITEGRTLCLFTSHRLMQRAATGLRAWWGGASDGVRELDDMVLVQGERPADALVREFRHRPETVLLATGSFWQGIDIPGPALSQVIIDKLPFAPPDDPREAERGRRWEEAGGDAFSDLQLPAAALAFRQGVGRLIRRRDDRGLVSVLDRRLLARRYGEVFLAAIPAMPRTASVERARRWWQQGANDA